MKNYSGNIYKLALRGMFTYLLISGIINVLGIAVSFFIKLEIGNLSYHENLIWLYLGIAEWVIFILVYGFKYMENIGYIDDYDHIHYMSSYFRHMSLVLGFLTIPILLSIGGGGAVFSYIISLCYEPNLILSHLINNETYFNGWRNMGTMMHYWPQLGGIVITFAINLLALLPFYILGKHHRKEDLKNGYKLRIKS